MVLGRIYSITLKDDALNKPLYIGSTTSKLNTRWNQHKSKHNDCASQQLFQSYGADALTITLVKEYSIIDSKHLQAIEQLWMNKLKIKNQNSAFQINKLYQKQYAKQYKVDNPDTIKRAAERYQKKNEEKIKARKAEKMTCECGGSWTKGHGFKRHEKTKRHQTWHSSQ